jgi:carbonic anhydrase
MDARLNPYGLLGLSEGDAHVIRNAGGVVTDDEIRSLAISQRLLGTEEIVVVMHEDCGLHGAAPELGGFDDLDAALAGGLARLRSNAALPARDQIRGFVFSPDTGTLREVAAPES